MSYTILLLWKKKTNKKRYKNKRGVPISMRHHTSYEFVTHVIGSTWRYKKCKRGSLGNFNVN